MRVRRGLAAEVFGPQAQGQEKQDENIISHIRGLGKTVAEKRAIEGQGFDVPAEDLLDPLSAEEMAVNRLKWLEKLRRFEKRIEGLDP